jgi:hypothetical protein
MDETLVAPAIVAWVRQVLPEIQAGYDHDVFQKGALPDVVVSLDGASVTVGADDFPFSSIQQRHVVVWRMTVSFMVDNTDDAAADTQLKDFARRLRSNALLDGTLGGRVPFISRIMDFDFSAPYVEYDDGTRGREMNMTLAVGDLVEAE